MAPSRDRLLHFGFKATVSDRGRELGGQKDVGASSGRRGSDQIRAGDPRLKAQVPRGSLRASEPSQCWRGSGDVPVPVLLFSPVRGHARTRTRPTAHTPCPPPPTPARAPKQARTWALPCFSLSWWAGARSPHVPGARGLTVRGCAGWGRGGLAPPLPSAPPLPRRSEARAALPNEERRCWQVGSVFVLG